MLIPYRYTGLKNTRKCQLPIKIQLKAILLWLKSMAIVYSKEHMTWILN